MIQKMQELFELNKGNLELKIFISENKFLVPLKSKNIKVNANDRLIKELKKLNIEVELLG